MRYDAATPSTVFGADDEEKENPDTVDLLLTKELLGLSFKERNAFQEEIHGVVCLARDETPSLLKKSLERLQQEIDVMPDCRKEAYLKSQTLANVIKNNSPSCTTYVNTDGFRLRFLRCELFDATKAAVRMTKFLDVILDIFGEYALQRPIRLSDFSTMELRNLRKGRYQFLPYRDRAATCGRRVLCVFPDQEWEAIPPRVRNKILIYLVWVAGEDVNTQKEGFVVVCWIDHTFKVSKSIRVHTKDHQTLTVRISALHICSSDTPLHRFRRAIIAMRIGHNRSRLKQHVGESMELRYALQSYGIPVDQIPITYTGKVKVTYFRQWLRLRDFVEGNRCDKINHSIELSRTNQVDDNNQMIFCCDWNSCCEDKSNGNSCICYTAIESPYLNDIIFRKGANTSSHPGNAVMSRLIADKTKQELYAQHEQQLVGENNKRTKMKLFVSEIIQEIREKNSTERRMCRFLVWDERGWWTEILNEYDIQTRVEYIARGIRNTVTKNYRSSTPLMQSPINMGYKCAYIVKEDERMMLGAFATQRQLKDDAMFRYQDFCSGLDKRKQKRFKAMTNSSGDGDGIMMASETRFCGSYCF